MRRSNFPDKPSRFQSLHAFQKIEDATKFRKEYCESKGYIWEVKFDNAFKVDMNLLNLEGSLLQLSYKINKYWSGLQGEIKKPFWEFLLKPPIKVLKNIE